MSAPCVFLLLLSLVAPPSQTIVLTPAAGSNAYMLTSRGNANGSLNNKAGNIVKTQHTPVMKNFVRPDGRCTIISIVVDFVRTDKENPTVEDADDFTKVLSNLPSSVEEDGPALAKSLDLKGNPHDIVDAARKSFGMRPRRNRRPGACGHSQRTARCG